MHRLSLCSRTISPLLLGTTRALQSVMYKMLSSLSIDNDTKQIDDNVCLGEFGVGSIAGTFPD